MTTSKSRTDLFVERCADLLIAKRRLLFWVFVLVTAVLAASAMRTRLDPGFTKLIPLRHEYMVPFLKFSKIFTGANRLLVSVHWKGKGDIYNPEFMNTLRKVTEDVFFISGVSRSSVTSLFTSNVSYVEVTEQGFVGDVVIPSRFSGTPEDMEKVRSNVVRAGQIGSLVANDLKSAMIRADLQEIDPETGKHVDYAQIAKRLEEVRAKYENKDIEINVVGFSKLVGDVMDGLGLVLTFFAASFFLTALILWIYSRSLKLTALALVVAMLPVIWLLGLLPVMGLGIDPMSILVPFLIFSIGVSHAVQMTNAWKQDKLAGASSMDAAHSAFCKIFIPGAVALLTNALGFMVIMLIDIPIVHELGITACLGVLLMIITNKLMLPVILTYMNLEAAAMKPHEFDDVGAKHPLWWRLSAIARPRPALAVFVVAMAFLAVGTWQARKLETGDIGAGAPELRADSRYNIDNDRIVKSYSIGLDVLSVYATALQPGGGCTNPDIMGVLERFEVNMRQVAGVQSVSSVITAAKTVIAGNNEGNPRWSAIPKSTDALRQGSSAYQSESGMVTGDCREFEILVFLKDHEGATLHHVVGEAKRFIEAEKSPAVQLELAGGNGGVGAATNESVDRAERTMLGAIFISIAVLCWITFRSVRAVLCILVPLTIVSILCNAIMPLLGIGLKVATLPVVALGVGVGVDYGIYLFERIQHEMADGKDLRVAFYEALRQRGTAAVFTALTMSLSMATWIFAALKFQADMGLLLAFMFLVNLFGAIFMLPAMAAWFNEGRRLVPVAPHHGDTH